MLFLHTAIAKQDSEAIKYLLEYADLEERNEAGQTVLHYVIEKGNEEILSLLMAVCNKPNQIGSQLDIEARTPLGQTALMLAVQKQAMAVINLLLKNKSSVAACDYSGVSVWHLAAYYSNLAIWQLLLTQENPSEKEDNEGNNLFHWAIKGGKKELLDQFPRSLLSLPNHAGLTPLEFAIQQGQVDFIKPLLALGSPLRPLTLTLAFPLLASLEIEEALLPQTSCIKKIQLPHQEMLSLAWQEMARKQDEAAIHAFQTLAKSALAAKDWIALVLAWQGLAKLDRSSLLQTGYYYSSAWALLRSLPKQDAQVLEDELLKEYCEWGNSLYDVQWTPQLLRERALFSKTPSQKDWQSLFQSWLRPINIPYDYTLVGWDMLSLGPIGFSFLITDISPKRKKYFKKLGERLALEVFSLGAGAYGYLAHSPWVNSITLNQPLLEALSTDRTVLIKCDTPQGLIEHVRSLSIPPTLAITLHMPCHLAGSANLLSKYQSDIKRLIPVNETKKQVLQAFEILIEEFNQAINNAHRDSPFVQLAYDFMVRTIEYFAVFYLTSNLPSQSSPSLLRNLLSPESLLNQLESVLEHKTVQYLKHTWEALKEVIADIQTTHILPNEMLRQRSTPRAGITRIYQRLMGLVNYLNNFQTQAMHSNCTVIPIEGDFSTIEPIKKNLQPALTLSQTSEDKASPQNLRKIFRTVKKNALAENKMRDLHLEQMICQLKGEIENAKLNVKQLQSESIKATCITPPGQIEEQLAWPQILQNQLAIQWRTLAHLLSNLYTPSVDNLPSLQERDFNSLLGLPYKIVSLLKRIAVYKTQNSKGNYTLATVIELLAIRISEIYALQIANLTNESLNNLAVLLAKFMIKGMSKLSPIHSKVSPVDYLITAMMWPTLRNDIEQETCLSLQNGKSWTAEGLIQRSGVALIHGSELIYQSFPSNTMNQSACYGYRLLNSSELEAYCQALSDFSDLAYHYLPKQHCIQTLHLPRYDVGTNKQIKLLEKTLMRQLVILPHELERGDKLGEGAVGIVYKGKWKNKPVAIKEAHEIALSEETLQELAREGTHITSLSHPNIIQMYGYGVDNAGHFCCLVMEFAAGGCLYHYLHSKKPLSLENSLQIMIDIVHALDYLHQYNVIHRDLKSSNVLLTQDKRAKVTDFGTVKLKSTSAIVSHTLDKNMVGSLSWLAPEVLQDKPRYSYASDIYSYGMTLWEIVARQLPYLKVTNPAIVIPQKVIKGERETIPEACHPKIKKVIESCWKQNPLERPSAAFLIQKLSGIFVKELNRSPTSMPEPQEVKNQNEERCLVM